MDFLKDAFFCEPTWQGQIGASLLQFSIWSFITNYQYGVMSHVYKFVKSRPWYRNAQDNFKDDDAQKMYNFEDAGLHYVVFFQTCIHHGGGGLIMLLGMLTGQAWIWRHGMLVEVGGMDLLDFVRIMHAKLLPPGTFPTSLMVKAPPFVPLMFFHHSVGICVGIPVNLFFSEVFEFQLFGLVILGAPVLSLLPGLYIKTLPHKDISRLLLANQIYTLLMFGILQRTVYHFPASIRCFLYMWRSPIFSWGMAVPFIWAMFAMSVFNLFVVMILSQGLYKTLTATTKEEKEEASTLLRHASSMSVSRMGSVVAFSSSQKLTNLFAASRIISKAHHARMVLEKEAKAK